MRRVGLIFVATVICLLTIDLATANACFRDRDLRISGVFEEETIASAPAFLFRDRATATIVTRHWGDPPADLQLQHEGMWSIPHPPNSDLCPPEYRDDRHEPDVGSTGSIRYSQVGGAEPLKRDLITDLTSRRHIGRMATETEVERLVSLYGPTHYVTVPFTTRVLAWTIVWGPVVVMGGIVAALVYAAAFGLSKLSWGKLRMPRARVIFTKVVLLAIVLAVSSWIYHNPPPQPDCVDCSDFRTTDVIEHHS
jgi:hypothetical protein